MLSDEAVFAALQWGIQDRSTTIRETKYLVEALELLSKDILEVYFNIKQLSIQEVERQKLETNLRYLTAVLQPFIKLKQAVFSAADNEGFKGSNLEKLWSTERDPVSRQKYYIYKGSGDRERFSRHGWYEFFDGDRGRPFYGLLGERGWEIVTWKKPHEVKGKIARGSKEKSNVSIVVWKKPKVQSRITKSKLEYIEERLRDLDAIMDHLEEQASSGVEFPHFTVFHEILAEIVKITLASGNSANSHTLLSLDLDEHSGTIKKEISRRLLRMPRLGSIASETNKNKEMVVEIGKKKSIVE